MKSHTDYFTLEHLTEATLRSGILNLESITFSKFNFGLVDQSTLTAFLIGSVKVACPDEHVYLFNELIRGLKNNCLTVAALVFTHLFEIPVLSGKRSLHSNSTAKISLIWGQV